MMPMATLVLGLAVLAAACASPSDDGSPDTTVPPPTSSTTTPPSDPLPTVPPSSIPAPDEPTPPVQDEIREEAAIADLTERLGIPENEVTVELVETVTWNDGSIGCPQPGESYTQALVPGYRVVLEANGQTFDYHGIDGQNPFLCEKRLATGDPKHQS